MRGLVDPAINLHVLREAAAGRGVCVRAVAARHGVAPAAVVDALADLTLAGVVECSATPVPGFLTLRLGPKSVQAIFLFALNGGCGDDSPAGQCSTGANAESIFADSATSVATFRTCETCGG